MRAIRRLGLVTALVTAVTVATTGLAPAAHAIPDTLGQHRLTFYFVDPDRPYGSPCAIGVTMSSSLDLVNMIADEWGYIDVDPLNLSCTGVPWTARVTIVDYAPPHPTRAVSDEDGPEAAPTAVAEQHVPYGIGVREAGVVTFQFEAFSRVGEICALDVWHVNAVTRTAEPFGPPVACVS
jgi:hypothetical protein